MNNNDFFAFKFFNEKLVFLDQTKLPLKEVYIETADYNRIAEAVEKLEIRGAPAIGIAAAYALALSVKKTDRQDKSKLFRDAYDRLVRTRPTAVNLFWALEKMKAAFELRKESEDLYSALLEQAEEIHRDDQVKCENIATNGLRLFKKKSKVLTHCNTGKLATGGNGTALNIINKAFEAGMVSHVHVDETRPLLQGSRLTSFELSKLKIPFTIHTDSSAAFLMQKGEVDLVITGADRIALNGDTANKIGTYNLAVLCNYHDIPFYIAAPSSTIDNNIKTGSEIKIEERSKSEILKVNDIQITRENYEVFSPAFDITPSFLIKAIITEDGIFYPPYKFIR